MQRCSTRPSRSQDENQSQTLHDPNLKEARLKWCVDCIEHQRISGERRCRHRRLADGRRHAHRRRVCQDVRLQRVCQAHETLMSGHKAIFVMTMSHSTAVCMHHRRRTQALHAIHRMLACRQSGCSRKRQRMLRPDGSLRGRDGAHRALPSRLRGLRGPLRQPAHRLAGRSDWR